MRIGFFAPANEFTDAILDGLTRKLTGDTLTQWQPGSVPPAASDVEVLLAIGLVDRELMESLPNLAFIQTLSDGYERVDIDAATKLGIRVSYSPGDMTGNADSVAEYTVMLMLAAARRLSIALASIQDSSIKKPGRGGSLIGANVCIVGLGRIGSKIAHRLLAFGARLTAVDRFPMHAPKYIPTCTPDGLKEAVDDADFVVLSVRASKENVHMIDGSVMSAMKKGAILINIARGSLVDEQALYQAIKSGHLGGAGLDVEEHEPIPANDPLLTLPQVFITPHQAGLTELNVQGTVEYVADVLAKIKADQPIDSQLNHPANRRSSAIRASGSCKTFALLTSNA
jgi:phosphoglycerate dehydrogenase-like enzyme